MIAGAPSSYEVVFNDEDEHSVVSDVEISRPRGAVTGVTITSSLNSSLSNSINIDFPPEQRNYNNNNNNINSNSNRQKTAPITASSPVSAHVPLSVSVPGSVPVPITMTGSGRSKPNTAPQLFRTPIFSDPVPPRDSPNPATEVRSVRGSSPSPVPAYASANFNINTNAAVPQRPTTGKPPSASKTTRKQQNVNLENRILLKMAAILPSDSTKNDLESTDYMPSTPNNPGVQGPGRLPESRSNLLKLNSELDEMIKDTRDLSLESDLYNFGMVIDYSKITDETIAANIMENGTIVYDAIIADLTTQAAKKVGRLKKFYRNHIQRMKVRHEEDLDELRLKLQELTSKFHEVHVAQSTEILRMNTADSEDIANQNVVVPILRPDTTPDPVIFDESGDVPLPKKSQRDMLHEYITTRLDEERKMALTKVRALSKELIDSQNELRTAQEEIKYLKESLLEKERESYDKDRVALNDMTSYLKSLLETHK